MDNNIKLMFCFSLLIVISIVRGVKFQRNIPLPHACVNLVNALHFKSSYRTQIEIQTSSFPLQIDV
jgi:hypothetical protein